MSKTKDLHTIRLTPQIPCCVTHRHFRFQVPIIVVSYAVRIGGGERGSPLVASLTTILNLLESLRAKERVQDFLQKRSIPYTGTWLKLRERIEESVSKKKIAVTELISLLEEVEESGNQYVFFYDLDLTKASRIVDAASFEKCLTKEQKATALNAVHVMGSPPDTATLVAAKHGNINVKLKWIQNRVFRRPLDEIIKGKIVTVRYEIVDARAVDLALFDLQQSRAYLFVQKIEPNVRDYRNQLQSLIDRLVPTFLDEGALQPLDLGKVLKRLNDKGFSEARRRNCLARDETGGVFDVTSATEEDDIFDGGLYKTARDHYSGQITSLQANAYWKPISEKLEHEVHAIFPYRRSENAVVLTQRCTSAERDYVLSRIESIAREQ